MGKTKRHQQPIYLDHDKAALLAKLAKQTRIPRQEYLREEWLVAAKGFPNHAEPQGPLSFHGLAARAMHNTGLFEDEDHRQAGAGGNSID